MPTNYFRLIVLMFVNFIDILILYLLSYKFLDRKPPFSKQHLIGGAVYGLAIGITSYYIGLGDLFQLIIMVLTILIFYYLHQRKHQLKFFEIMMIYLLAILFLLFTRLPQTIVIININLISNRSVQNLLIVTIQLFCVLWLIRKRWLTKGYERIASDIFLQIIIAITAIFLIVSWAVLSFEISTLYLLLFGSLMGSTIFSLYQLIPIIYFHTKELPRLLHDRNTELMAHHARTHTESECKYAKASVNLFMEKADMNPNADSYLVGKYKENIDAFIEKKIDYHQTKMEFKRYINYLEPHEFVKYDELLYMIGILMDNAIESGRQSFPAHLTVSCIHSHLMIEQSNATLSSVTNEKIEKMLQIGVSTKAKYGRGYGLHNLKDLIENYGGKLEIASSCDREYKSEYIVFKITISSYAQ